MSKIKYSYQNLSLKDIEGEVWEDIPGLDGACQISSFGRIKSLRRWVERSVRGGFWKNEKILSSCVHIQRIGKRKIRRLVITISFEGKKHSISIARIVYYLFVRKFDLSDRKILITYKDEDPLNIRPENLLLSNASVRIVRAYEKNHRARDSFGNSALNLTQYDLSGNKINIYKSISEAGKLTNISSSRLSVALKNKTGYSSGFIWLKGNGKEKLSKIPDRVKKIVSSKKLHDTVVSQYDLTGRKIREYPNIRSAAKAVKSQTNHIKLASEGKAFSAKGYYWNLGKGPSKINAQLIRKKQLEKLRKSICRPVIKYHKNGNKIKIYPSITEAARSMKVSDMSIISALRSGGFCKGFYWKYVD